MAEAQAWLLQLAEGTEAAIGIRELLHLVPQPLPWVAIPRAPEYCRHALWWDEHIVPVFDLENWLFPGKKAAVKPLVGIVAYQEDELGPVNYGALMLATSPRQIRVDDANACALSGSTALFQPIAIAAFNHASGVVPILNLTSIFTHSFLHPR